MLDRLLHIPLACTPAFDLVEKVQRVAPGGLCNKLLDQAATRLGASTWLLFPGDRQETRPNTSSPWPAGLDLSQRDRKGVPYMPKRSSSRCQPTRCLMPSFSRTWSSTRFRPWCEPHGVAWGPACQRSWPTASGRLPSHGVPARRFVLALPSRSRRSVGRSTSPGSRRRGCAWSCGWLVCWWFSWSLSE